LHYQIRERFHLIRRAAKLCTSTGKFGERKLHALWAIQTAQSRRQKAFMGPQTAHSGSGLIETAFVAEAQGAHGLQMKQGITKKIQNFRI
jgi:hypothetical protein